jgi:hypothetical protein
MGVSYLIRTLNRVFSWMEKPQGCRRGYFSATNTRREDGGALDIAGEKRGVPV